MTLPSPNVPRSQTPSQSLSPITSRLFDGDLLLPSRFSTLSACDFVSRGSIASLALRPICRSCLRLTHLVTSMSPRLDSRWGGSFPLPVRELTRWKRQAWPDAPKKDRTLTSKIQFTLLREIPTASASNASCWLRPGRNPYENPRKSSS